MSKHISIPLRRGVKGFFATVDRETAVKENLRSIIFTEPGERLMRNDIGTPIRSQQWDPADDITVSSMVTHLKRQLTLYEPRIRLLNVSGSVEFDDVTQVATVRVEIEYIILSSQRFDSIAVGIQLGKAMA